MAQALSALAEYLQRRSDTLRCSFDICGEFFKHTARFSLGVAERDERVDHVVVVRFVAIVRDIFRAKFFTQAEHDLLSALLSDAGYL